MPSEQSAGYLPGDPRYGLQGEVLKDYYRTKPAQWAIYCWDKPGMEAARLALVAEQNSYVKNFGERVIGYGHFMSDDGCDMLGTSFFMQLDDCAATDKFVADAPMNKAGVYQRVEIHRWSNSFQKRAADYARKGLQQFLCTGPKTGTPEFFREHLHAHESYFASYGDSFIFRGPIRSADGADNIGTALLIELPNRAAADRFWNEEPFARNGGYQRDVRITRWVFGIDPRCRPTLAPITLVSVRRVLESYKSDVIQGWWPVIRKGSPDVDEQEPSPLRPQQVALSERFD